MDRRTFIGSGTAASAGILLSSNAHAKKKETPVNIPDRALSGADIQKLTQVAKEVFAHNRVEMDGFTFHVPSADLYVSLFAWDSGWHAIAMSRIDAGLAASEVEFLLMQQLDNGLVPHEVLFDELTKNTGIERKALLAVVKNQYDENQRSRLVDPPSFIIAAEKIFDVTKDEKWLRRILPKLEKCVKYLTEDRDLFGDGLVSIIHPWESGTDSSPVFDGPLGLNISSPMAPIKQLYLYTDLINFCNSMEWDPKRLREKNRFVFEDLTVNSITISGLTSLSRLFEALGEKIKQKKYMDQAKSMMDAMVSINLDDKDGCFFPRFDPDNPKLSKRTTCASLLPLMTGLVPEDKAGRLIREHLLNPDEFWLSYLVPFNADDELAGERIYIEDLLLWRGQCIWGNMNWMVVEGLKKYGFNKEADEITRRTGHMILKEGFREFYDYRTGRGGGATNFNWPGLILDMLD